MAADKPFRESLGNFARWKTFARTLSTDFASLRSLLTEDDLAKIANAAALRVQFFLESGQTLKVKESASADTDFILLDASVNSQSASIYVMQTLDQVEVAAPSGTPTLRFAVYFA